MKRFLRPLLMLAVVVAACIFLNPTKAHAASVDDLTYSITNGEVTITGYKTKPEGELAIPATIDGCPVTTIGPSTFHDCDRLSSVTIGNSITTIGNGAFSWCNGLTRVTIGDSVTTIVAHAFSNCDRLSSLTIGNSVTTIGDGAFRECSSLTSVTISNGVTTIGDYVFFIALT